MPLKALVDAQVDELRGFLEQPRVVLRVLRHLNDMKPMLLKLLAGVQEEEDFPHAMLMIDLPFDDEESYCAAALAELVENNETHRESLSVEGITLPRSPEASQEPGVVTVGRYVSEVADALQGYGLAYVLLIDPQSVTEEDPDAFATTLLRLTHTIRSDHAKLLVLDSSDAPRLAGIELRTELADVQHFDIGPTEIERQVKLDIDAGQLDTPDLCKYLMMAGAFAAARGDHAGAIAFQSRALAASEEVDEPAAQAQSLYNLGTSQMESGDLEAGAASLSRAAEICIEEELDPLLAMVMINLGVTLHRNRQVDEALEAFEIARRTFGALNNRPGEAFALDNRAAVLAAEKRNEEAEASWLEELELYEGITNEAMPELRESCREDVVAKLTRFYDETGQHSKISALHTRGGAG